jgi:hypothetical protein
LDAACRRRLKIAASANTISPLNPESSMRMSEKSISAAVSTMTVDSSRVRLRERSYP